MNKGKHPFVFNCAKQVTILQYLGPDGLPTEETHKLYVTKCAEFKAKARKYARGNLCTKNSNLHQFKCGYSSSEKLEEVVVLERTELLRKYTMAFDVTFFYEDPNSMYECFGGKSKRIRIIRELDQKRKEEFSRDFDRKKACWFTRYCVLSRFIEAARNVILLNRLRTVLVALKSLTPEALKKIEHETMREDDAETEGNETKGLSLQDTSQILQL